MHRGAPPSEGDAQTWVPVHEAVLVQLPPDAAHSRIPSPQRSAHTEPAGQSAAVRHTPWFPHTAKSSVGRVSQVRPAGQSALTVQVALDALHSRSPSPSTSWHVMPSTHAPSLAHRVVPRMQYGVPTPT